ncbi:Imm21 family immunity protein [Streptomyces albidoflavus]
MSRRPLIVLPESAVRLWSGCTEDGEVLGEAGGRDDYDRACEVGAWPATVRRC